MADALARTMADALARTMADALARTMADALARTMADALARTMADALHALVPRIWKRHMEMPTVQEKERETRRLAETIQSLIFHN